MTLEAFSSSSSCLSLVEAVLQAANATSTQSNRKEKRYFMDRVYQETGSNGPAISMIRPGGQVDHKSAHFT
jgi:hypothetical protein